MLESVLKQKIIKTIHSAAYKIGTCVECYGISDRFLEGFPDILVLTKGKPFFIEGKRNSKKYSFTESQKTFAVIMKDNLQLDVIGIEGESLKNLKVYEDISKEEYLLMNIELLELYFKMLIERYERGWFKKAVLPFDC